jgi:hypothetical protein
MSPSILTKFQADSTMLTLSKVVLIEVPLTRHLL